jgi:uncharacterized protein (DUF1800 family)
MRPADLSLSVALPQRTTGPQLAILRDMLNHPNHMQFAIPTSIRRRVAPRPPMVAIEILAILLCFAGFE